MADDGILINFDTGSAPYTSKASFKGGSWKDRRSAKKALDVGRQRAARRLTGNGGAVPSTAVVEAVDAVEPESNDRPAKRARTEAISDPVTATSVSRPRANTSAKRTSQQNQQADKPKHIVSSLFTYNPKAQTKPSTSVVDGQVAQPSNAPLDDELSTFTSLGLSAHVADHLMRKMNIKAPTAIQRSAIAQLMRDDSDAFIQAQTGSGKTLAYLLPIVERIIKLSPQERCRPADEANGGVGRSSGLFAIVLAPTRELSKQISTVLESLLRCAHWIVSGTVIGGEKKKSEKARLRKGLNVLIATPGRLADHLDHTEALDVSNVRWLVLDEGDRLMELGFEQDIAKILSKLDFRKKKAESERSALQGLPSKRTTVLCSATMKMGVQTLGELSLTDAVHLWAEADGNTSSDATKAQREAFTAPAQLKQSFAIVPSKLRLVSLAALLKRTFSRRGAIMKVIVFMSCADSVDFHFDLLTRTPPSTTPATTTSTPQSDSKATSAPAHDLTPASSPSPVQLYRLHGSLPQAQRTSTLASFRGNKDPALLIATDVASRGLDLPNVDFVVEYDPPFSQEEHLHRVGRTARAGRDGRAMIFLLPGSEEGYIKLLDKFAEQTNKDGGGEGAAGRVGRTTADDLLLRGFGGGGVEVGKKAKEEAERRATEWQLEVERWVLADKRREESAKRAFQSHVRAYATHVAEERGMFDMKSLHLGHLCKAFGVRDPPGGLKVPGLRSAKGIRGARTGSGGGGGKTDGPQEGKDLGDAGPTDAEEARRKMRSLARKLGGGSSEFNLG